MLRYYLRDGTRIKLGPVGQQPASVDPTCPLVWLDLFNPSPEEDRRVEQLVGVSIPSREEMEEIEVSARLYQEDGAEFMTITAVIQLDTEEPVTTPITFVLKGATLVTVRYAEPTAFSVFVARAQKPNAVPCANGEQIMMGLIEALFDRMADALERVGTALDAISRAVFRKKSSGKSAKTTRDLQAIIEKIGQDGDLLTMIHESLVSINRALTYHTSVAQEDKKVTKEAKARAKVLYRDVVALTDQATFLSNNQFPTRCHARPYQPTAEPDHQDIFCSGRRVPAPYTGRLHLRHELRPHAGAELGARVSMGSRSDGAFSHSALSLLQKAWVALSTAVLRSDKP